MSDHRYIRRQIGKEISSHSLVPPKNPFKTRGFGNGMQARSAELPTTNLLQKRSVSSPTQQPSQPQQTPDLQTQLEQAERFGYNAADIPVLAPSATASLPIQAKLTMGEPGDSYEQEADQVAAQVVEQINAPPVQREAMQEDELREKPEAETIQRQDILDEGEEQQISPKLMVQAQSEEDEMSAPQDLEASIQGARGGGQPLADGVREPMEGAFGTDFSGVRVHTDATSDQLNQSIQAKAFTTGTDIFFRQGAYDPSSRGGQELLAHELTHVVQQNGSRVQRHQDKDELQTKPMPHLQRQDKAGEEDTQDVDLTLEQEQEILRAKKISQPEPLVETVQLQHHPEETIQRAWTGRRQLGGGGLNSLLGKPSVWRTKGNFLNWGGYHEHIFYEDGQDPADVGHMGKQGLGQDTARKNEYSKVRTGLDDTRMREAVGKVSVNPGEYSLLSNNCQAFVAKVLSIYDQSQ